MVQLKREIREKDQVLSETKCEILQMDQKLKHSNRKCAERGTEEQKLLEDINRVNAELRKCREDYSSLESENSRILVSGDFNISKKESRIRCIYTVNLI